MKKYELIESDFHDFYRVQALRDFNDVKKGGIGGYVSGEHNLSHGWGCWVYGDAIVCDDAQVCGNARVYGSAQVCGDAQVYGNARVYGTAQVYGDAIVCDDAQVCGNARVYGSAQVYGYSHVYGDAHVRRDAHVCGDAHVSDRAQLNFSHLCCDITHNRNIKIAVECSLGYVPDPRGFYVMYKKVDKTVYGVMESLHDTSFEYNVGKTYKVPNAPISTESCAAGLHVSTPHYWREGNCLIACRVHIDDIITVQDGKIRCKKLKVLYEVEGS